MSNRIGRRSKLTGRQQRDSGRRVAPFPQITHQVHGLQKKLFVT